MPTIQVVFYKDDDGCVPVLKWLRECKNREKRVYAKCLVRISRLSHLGYEMRRPEADYLRDGIYELRIRFQSVNYRILYFFHRQSAAILAHSLVKEATIPDKDIELAKIRKARFEMDPERHSHYE